jgi:GH15 family glucan-1,4-alpha-glucosidase
MASDIGNYGFLSNLHGSALVSRDGSVDWCCMPKFDSAACMAALLGRDEHGLWTIHPAATVRRTTRRYRPGTLVLETDFECDGGAVRLIDFMPFGNGGRNSLIRIVEGLDGIVPVHIDLVVRFGYGAYKPWITKSRGDIAMITAPHACVIRSTSPVRFDDSSVFSDLSVNKGERVSFELTWYPSSEAPPPMLDIANVLASTEQRSREWAGRSTYRGRYADVVNQSLLVLKGMIYHPSGGIVAAPTAGLPEEIGGVRNWDYRYCWLRDATLTLDALMLGGYVAEAAAWREWLLNAVAGEPEALQIMYGIEGERRLTEFEATWLPGYEESRPVRIGNAAAEQFQLDVYGEVLQSVYEARRLGLPEARDVRGPARRYIEFVAKSWQKPDDGIWEVRGGRRHFVHSKMMAWVAVDRMVRIVDEFGPRDHPMREDLPRYRALRDRIHRDVCEHGFDRSQNAFTQAYGRPELDAAVLLMPALGFLPASDPRVQGTIKAIEKNLTQDGFVLRYKPEHTGDGLAGTEGVFLACSFWLVDAYAYAGRTKDAERFFDRLLTLRNDLGLLSEEYDPLHGRLLGNFPQAFSHLALIHSASVLSDAELTPRAETDGQRQVAAPAPPP